MNCYRCGKNIVDGSLFCVGCGSKQPVSHQPAGPVNVQKSNNMLKYITAAGASLLIICVLIFVVINYTGNSVDKVVDKICKAAVERDVDKLTQLAIPVDDSPVKEEVYYEMDVLVDMLSESRVVSIERADNNIYDLSDEYMNTLSQNFKVNIKDAKKIAIVLNGKYTSEVRVYKIKGKWYGFINES